MDDRITTRKPRQPAPAITCSGCDARWTAAAAAHCSACHTTCSGVRLFDRHRTVFGEHGTCTDPADLRDPHGEPLCELRDGIWRFPEMDEATKAARFGATP